MKKFNKAFAVCLLTILCTINVSFVATATSDDDDNRITVTERETEKATTKATEKATTKATEKATSKATEKATEKATSKATEKATSKATAKATSKATSKATEKATEDTDKVVLDSEDEEDVLVVEATDEPTLNVQNGGVQLENKKYLTKGGAFLWFLFGVIVSAVISFAISYRFYMMAKRDNHVVAEFRALKRDIDSKMVGTVGGVTEYDMSVSNANPSYARDSRPIRTTRSYESDEKSDEIYKKWESQIQHTRSTSSPEESSIRRSSRQSETARRTSSGDRRRPVKKNTGVTGKIKDVFNDMFNK